MHNPYKTKQALLAASFVAVSSLSACNTPGVNPEPEIAVNPPPTQPETANPTTPPQPEIAVNPAPPPQPEPEIAVNPAPPPQPEPEIAVNPAPPGAVTTPGS